MTVFLLTLTLLLCGYMPAGEATGQARILRVGYVERARFWDVNGNGDVTGYGATYLAAIGRIAEWQYEFVPGTWTECLQALQDGTIDLLLPVEYSDERAKRFLFSDEPCCKSYTALLCRADDDNMCYLDENACAGRNVGLLRGSYRNEAFEAYVAETGMSVNRIYYEDEATMNAALADGLVDAIVSVNLNVIDGQKLLHRIDYTPGYIVASVSQPLLMQSLNEATEQLLLNDPFYVEKLQETYYGDAERSSIGFTHEEQAFIRDCEPLTVLFDSDDYPQEWYDKETASYRGLYPQLLQLIADKTGLTFTAVPPSTKSSWDRIGAKEAALLVSAYDAPELSEKYGITFTSSYYISESALIAKRNNPYEPGSALRVALLGNQSGVISCARQHYPSWKLVTCDTCDECVRKVLLGEADAALINNIVLQTNGYLSRYSELVTVLPVAVEVPACIAVSDEQPAILTSILNKAILKISESEVQTTVWNTTLTAETPLTAGDLIRRYPVYALLLAVFVLLLIALTIFLTIYNHYKVSQNRLLEEKNRELESVNRLAARLRKQSETDMLTGLLNKTTAENACTAYLMLPDRGNAALFVMDIDNFKSINDRNGHQYGDMMLEEFGSALRGFCRQNDVVGRVGGDEFVILFKSFADREQLVRRAEAICGAFAADESTELTCSIGIAVCPKDGDTYEALFARADHAMYLAKQNGKCSYLFASDADAPAATEEAN